LARELEIDDSTPVAKFGDEVTRNIDVARERLGAGVKEARTSGTLRAPKRMLYSEWRLLSLRLAFFDGYTRAFSHLGVRRKSIFILAPFSEDDSLTSLVLRETALPPWVSTLVAPYRVQGHPVIREAVREFGETAVRTLLVTGSNPGVLYATNPSTIAMFLKDVRDDWQRVKRCAESVAYNAPLSRIVRRIASGGARERIARVASSPSALEVRELFPALEAYICWDGGYVKPFLERVNEQLPYARHIPMFSMSTEVVETIPTPARENEALAFVPFAPGVLYEFFAEGEDPTPSKLLRTWELEPGKNYVMVVSNRYGLRRYNTEDVFRCVRYVSGLPDLRFLRRANLSFSFTGEKLTAEQLAHVFGELSEQFPQLAKTGYLSCFPCRGDEATLPHFKLVWATNVADASRHLPASLALEAERKLAALNSEFAAKRQSNRLGPMQVVTVPVEELVRRAGGSLRNREWEAQFKFLPLYAKEWA
jgi:hypothetical protein